MALAAIRGGQSSTTALALIEPQQRPGVQALVFHVLRNLGKAQALRSKLAPRNPPAQIDALLCTALTLLWTQDGRAEGAPCYDAFTVVDQAVEAAKRQPTTRAQASFLNACLRRFLREREALLQAVANEPMASWNHPRWWIDRVRSDHPRQWREILQANNTQAPMTLRVNVRQIGRDEYMRQLMAEGIEAWPAGDSAVVLKRARPVQDLPGFAAGQVSVQDAGAQLAAPLLLQGLATGKPLRVLDACAAPGGKTAHLLELLPRRLHVTALDIDPTRCERIHQNLKRLGLDDPGQVMVLAADARTPANWWHQHCASQTFDAILLDAPCTASGIVRRHPDVRWLRRESDVAQLAIIQAALLSTLWPLLRPGGHLLYSTCSVFKAEGQEQIETFLAHHNDALMLPSPGHLLPQKGGDTVYRRDNASDDHDGFFYALLCKQDGSGA